MPKTLSLLLLCTLAAWPAHAENLTWPELDSWKGSAVEQFDKRTIFKAINGAAETFFRFGFLSLQVRNYAKGDQTLEVQVYEMADELGSFGVFSLEKPGKTLSLDLPAQHSCSPPFMASMRKGRHYLKLGALQGKLTEKDCAVMLNALAPMLPGGGALPEAFAALPGKGRIKGSEAYVRESFLGLSELDNCLAATYQRPEKKTYRIFFISDAPSISLGKKWQDVAGQAGLKQRKVPYEGQVFILVGPRNLWGLVGLDSASSAMEILSMSKSAHEKAKAPMTGKQTPTAPWTLKYHDGSNNGYVIQQMSEGDAITFEYRPVTPAKSSSGTYSGGQPRQATLSKEQAAGLWSNLDELESADKLRTESRSMGSGLFQITTPTGSRRFIVKAGRELSTWNSEMAKPGLAD